MDLSLWGRRPQAKQSKAEAKQAIKSEGGGADGDMATGVQSENSPLSIPGSSAGKAPPLAIDMDDTQFQTAPQKSSQKSHHHKLAPASVVLSQPLGPRLQAHHTSSSWRPRSLQGFTIQAGGVLCTSPHWARPRDPSARPPRQRGPFSSSNPKAKGSSYDAELHLTTNRLAASALIFRLTPAASHCNVCN